jgi:hypothetical protein
MPRPLKVASVVVGVWSVLYVMGGAVARYHGADFTQPNAIKAHIARHLRYRTQARPDELRPAIDVGIGYVCDEKIYGWNPRADATFVDSSSHGKAAPDAAGPRTIQDAGLETFVAGLGVAQPRPLPGVLQPLARHERGTWTTLAGGLSGFALGFWNGYAAAPDCGSRAFGEVVADKAFWRELAERLPLTKGMGSPRAGG